MRPPRRRQGWIAGEAVCFAPTWSDNVIRRPWFSGRRSRHALRGDNSCGHARLAGGLVGGGCRADFCLHSAGAVFLRREPAIGSVQPGSESSIVARKEWTWAKVIRRPEFFALVSGILVPSFAMTGIFSPGTSGGSERMDPCLVRWLVSSLCGNHRPDGGVQAEPTIWRSPTRMPQIEVP